MSQAASRSACRYALVLLAFLAILSQLWKLGSFFASNKEATHEVYFDVDGSYAVLIKTNTMSNGRIFIRNSPPIMYAGDGLATSTLQQHRRHSPAAQRSSKSNTDTLLFAHGGAMKPYQSIIKAQWVSKLQDLLKTINKDQPSLQQSQQNQITVVVSNTNYTLSLLNWLVSALVKTTPPLENVIVICLDKTLYTLLGRKKIPSLYVNPETVISGPMHTKSSHIWITRCAVYRLLNHWGYDIVAYDTDAIVLKNLQHILDAHHESDIVASSGTYPFQLGVKWGLTLCMGVILIRSTRSTGMYVLARTPGLSACII